MRTITREAGAQPLGRIALLASMVYRCPPMNGDECEGKAAESLENETLRYSLCEFHVPLPGNNLPSIRRFPVVIIRRFRRSLSAVGEFVVCAIY